MQATVKWFNVSKGYGFLDNGSGPDIYVNAKELKDGQTPQTGDQVVFECHVFDGKLVARDVHAAERQNLDPETTEDRENFGNRIDYRYGSRHPVYHRQQPHYVMR